MFGSNAVSAPVRAPPTARLPFFATCPVCGEGKRVTLVDFPQLAFARCASCGLIYKEQQIPGYGPGYEDAYFLSGRGKYMRRWAHRVRKCRRQLQHCLEFVPLGATLLDVGCSAGYVLEAAKSLGLSATGLDRSVFASTLCRQKGFNVVLGSLSNLPFPDESFDLVILKAVLEHVPDPMVGLREAARVLRPNGVIFVVVPDGDYFKHALMPRTCRDFRPDARGWQHHVYFHSPSIARACAQVGLTVVHEGQAIFRRRRMSRLPFPLEGARWLAMWLFSAVTRAVRLRRDIQAFAVKVESSHPSTAPSSGLGHLLSAPNNS